MTKQDKVEKVMHEWKAGTLTSNGRKVTDYDQAVAIALSEAGLSKYAEGGGVGLDNFYVKSNFGNFSVTDRRSNKMVVGYSKKEDAIITAKGLNDIDNSEELNETISKLKTMKGYGHFLNKYAEGGEISDLGFAYLADLWFAVQQKDTEDYEKLGKSLDEEGVSYRIQNEVSADATELRGRKSLSISEVHDRIKKILTKDLMEKGGNMNKYAKGGAVDAPKIYVADLEAYNNGKLVGEWLDLSDFEDGKDVSKEISKLLKKWGAEEYAIHDVENVPSSIYSEYMGEEDFDKIIKIYKASEENDLPYEVISEIILQYEPKDLEEWISDHYEGHFDNDTDLAYSVVENMGGVSDLGEKTTEMYFDYEGFGRDLEINDEWEGDFDSNEDRGYDYVENMGGVSELGDKTIDMYFDYEKFGRDLAINDYTEIEDGYYFRTPRYAKGGLTNERRYVNKSQDYEVRYAKNRLKRTGYKNERKFAVGGEIGNTVSFKGDYGTPRSGVVKEKRGSSYIVATDDGDRLVDSYEVISFSETPIAKKKRFGFFEGGGEILATSPSKDGIKKIIEQYLYGSTITLVETDNDKIYEVHNKKGKTPFHVEVIRGRYKFIQTDKPKFAGGGEIENKIEKLKKVVSSKMLPESVKAKAQAEIDKLEKELHESKETKAEEKEEHKAGGKEYKSKLEENLLKELHRLRADLTKDRLSKYNEGDNSEEAKALERERKSKITRMTEVLAVLNQIHESKETKAEEKAEDSEFSKDELNRLISSFEEINDFYEKNKKEPIEESDMGERMLSYTLKGLRKQDNKIKILLPYDKFNLLKKSKEVKAEDYVEAKTKALEKSLKDKTISETQRKRDEKELALFKGAEAKKPTTRKAPVRKAPVRKAVAKKVEPKSEFEVGDKVTVKGETHEIKEKKYIDYLGGGMTWAYKIPTFSFYVRESDVEAYKAPKADHKKLVAKLKAKKGGKEYDNRASLVPFTDKRRNRSESSDKKRSALPPGKRVSENGVTYYESRLNRTDLSKEDKFEKGGEVKGSDWGLNLNW
jgi:antirestriction protein